MTSRSKQPLYKEYRKERNRVLNLVRSYKNKGYDVEVNVPKIPKRITAGSIRRLQKITPKKVREQSFAPDLETGEKINYFQYKVRYSKAKEPAIEREYLSKGTPFTYQLSIDHVEDVILGYPERMRQLFSAKLKSAIALYGAKRVGEVLGEMIDNGEIVSEKEAYNYNAIIEMSNKLMEYLGFSREERMEMDRVAQAEMESSEDYEDEFGEWY